MVSHKAAGGRAVAMDVLNVEWMYCDVEEDETPGGHRERAQRERERAEPAHPSGAAGSSLLATVPVPSDEDQGPTPWPDKPGHPEPSLLGHHPSPSQKT